MRRRLFNLLAGLSLLLCLLFAGMWVLSFFYFQEDRLYLPGQRVYFIQFDRGDFALSRWPLFLRFHTGRLILVTAIIPTVKEVGTSLRNYVARKRANSERFPEGGTVTEESTPANLKDRVAGIAATGFMFLYGYVLIAMFANSLEGPLKWAGITVAVLVGTFAARGFYKASVRRFR